MGYRPNRQIRQKKRKKNNSNNKKKKRATRESKNMKCKATDNVFGEYVYSSFEIVTSIFHHQPI
jgi:hypothetical protein